MSGQRPWKVKAIGEALESIRRQLREEHTQLTPKMLEAQRLLDRRYAAMREQLRATGQYAPLSCQMLIHRVVLTVDMFPRKAFPWAAFSKMPGAEVGKRKRIWNQSYRFATRIKGIPNIREIAIQSHPTNGYAAGFRIVIVPDGSGGLQWADFQTIANVLPNFKFVVVECAWDFPLMSKVDVQYVQKTAIFGKSRPRIVGINPRHDTWGSRKGVKLVRSYVNFQTGIHRVELEVHARLLRTCRVNGPTDFPRLVEILLEKHILFARLDRGKLVAWLQRDGYTDRQVHDILGQVKDKSDNLWETLSYLRRRVHLKNVQRLLVPVDTQRAVRKAADEWIANWEREMAQEEEQV
jgi:hypothetical protein